MYISESADSSSGSGSTDSQRIIFQSAKLSFKPGSSKALLIGTDDCCEKGQIRVFEGQIKDIEIALTQATCGPYISLSLSLSISIYIQVAGCRALVTSRSSHTVPPDSEPSRCSLELLWTLLGPYKMPPWRLLCFPTCF